MPGKRVLSPPRTRNAPRTFASRCSAGTRTCIRVARTRLKTFFFNGIRIARASSPARISAWLNPRHARRRQCNGTGTTHSTRSASTPIGSARRATIILPSITPISGRRSYLNMWTQCADSVRYGAADNTPRYGAPSGGHKAHRPPPSGFRPCPVAPQSRHRQTGTGSTASRHVSQSCDSNGISRTPQSAHMGG